MYFLVNLLMISEFLVKCLTCNTFLNFETKYNTDMNDRPEFLRNTQMSRKSNSAVTMAVVRSYVIVQYITTLEFSKFLVLSEHNIILFISNLVALHLNQTEKTQKS